MWNPKRFRPLGKGRMKLYKEILMDHFQNPRNKGKLENPDFSTSQYNPSCGDSISFDGIIVNGIVDQLKFDGKGCVVSQAVASMLTEYCIGKQIDEILSVDKDTLLGIIGMEIGPTRMKCAFLSLVAMKEGLEEYKKKQESE